MIDADLNALPRHAAEVAALGDELHASVARWREALAIPCAPSVAAVLDAYAKDFAVYAEVLHSWADATRTAVSRYDAADRL